MNLHNHEYDIRLCVEYEGMILLLETFSDLEEVNHYLKDKLKHKILMGCTASISPEDIHDRDCEFEEYPLHSIDEISRWEIKDIRRYLEHKTDPARKRAHLAEVAYVCPDCFREVAECAYAVAERQPDRRNPTP